MDWREKSKCRQWLKRRSVFLYTPAQWREWGGDWQALSSWGSWGLSGKPGHRCAPHSSELGTSPAPGIRHLPGAGRDIRAVGSWRLSLLHFILSPLSYPCQWKSHGHSPCPAWGVLPGLFVKPTLPRICSPTRLGSRHLMGNFRSVSPNTVTVPLACDTAQKCLFQCGRGRGSSPCPPGPGPLPVQAKGKGLPGPFPPLSFLGTSGPGAAALPCIFTPWCL